MICSIHYNLRKHADSSPSDSVNSAQYVLNIRWGKCPSLIVIKAILLKQGETRETAGDRVR